VVNHWRVILAAAVIFAAGAATGGMAIRVYAPKTITKTQAPPPLPVSQDRRHDYLSKLDRELDLTPEQRQKIEAILAASQDRMKELWRSIEPQTKEEYQRTRKEISEVLTPEQREKRKQLRHQRDRDRDREGEQKQKTPEQEKNDRSPEACLRVKCKAC
jgi:Spy/CpxP family protein refolding chaperone